jgi:hypothetical protein
MEVVRAMLRGLESDQRDAFDVGRSPCKVMAIANGTKKEEVLSRGRTSSPKCGSYLIDVPLPYRCTLSTQHKL